MEWIAENRMVALIAACEVGFWVVLGAGLLARYVLKWRRTSVVLLLCTPVLDVVLLVAAAVDIGGGGEAGLQHALGTIYLGFSVVFGPGLIRWADARVAHRFAGGPPPRKVPKSGPVRLAHEWREWGKCVAACAIAAAAILFLSYVVGTPDRTEALWRDCLPRLELLIGAWFVLGPLWKLLDRRKVSA
ncbi:hypothetical protein [Actinokineospora sp. UTMC 2448]|uniref:hypothetical protein n=1 Tax=Actinokineospora sp. UTMC 2448 TaxID=2268449 RepID=UPI00216422D1|nr:hypothetical protein [Actinokineospora sp. UTMC 2448]